MYIGIERMNIFALMQYIKEYKDVFLCTLQSRARTSPMPRYHLEMIEALKKDDFQEVQNIIEIPAYKKQFQGVCWCLREYDMIEYDEHCGILKAANLLF